MARVTANPKKIQVEATDFASGVSEFALDAIAGSINSLLANAKGQLGDIRKSQLTELDFQSENGTEWILADGRDITGSDLAILTNTTLSPDLRAEFLKGNNGTLLTTESDSNKSHQHNTVRVPNTGGGGTLNTSRSIKGNPPGGGVSIFAGTSAEPNIGFSNSPGGSEARPLNIALNFFIKINR